MESASSHGPRRHRPGGRRSARLSAGPDHQRHDAACRPGRGLYAALLTPQGKILFDFLIAEGDGACCWIAPPSAPRRLVKRLTMYRLRAKIEIALRPQLSVYVGLTRTAGRTRHHLADPRLAALGPRSIGAAAEMPRFSGWPRALSCRAAGAGRAGRQRFRQRQDIRAGCGAGRTARRRLRQGLLCRPGTDRADEASRHGAQAHSRRAGATAPCRRQAPRLPADGTEVGEIISTYGRKDLRLCGSTA